ncbi:Conserved oligomeric Golgi complex subunit 3 [Vanrija pseudolonga]|uniref:Conserved oligomeric Golgi complex subunit 3 n=1 Tax=Vanrija pseudolonga TaxID=143232 RepID=A0AAF0YH79_9TREE|nr:Conserved oligomeric Golgi complex subunit 3 [Vanrija pseudolonga]
MSRPTTPGGFNLRRTPLPMASGGRASGESSRASTPLAAPNRVISLEEWESRAPLSDDQVQSIASVKERFGERPIPEKFFTESSSAVAGSSRPETPTRNKHLGNVHSRSGSANAVPSLPSSPGPGPSGLGRADPLHPSSIITPQQFHEHFAALTLSAEHEQDSLYREHLTEISGLRDKCDGLIQLLEDGEGEVGDMLKALEYVEERSESLRGACEDLLEEQTHLLTHTSQLAHRLSYFTFLETAQRMLNNPGNDLVLSPDFLPMVSRLDECISYLGEHRDFKDAELYLIRYQQCMTRSMQLIRLHFVGTIKALGMDIGRRLLDKGLSETTTRGLLYTRFTSLSASLRPLLSELEQRVTTNKDDLPQILADCHAAFVTTRQALMSPRVAEEIAQLDPARSELVDLTRSGCYYLKQTCLDEFTLFKQFFLSGEAQLYGYLESLCDHLYDHIRPRILHEPSLTVLQEVCTVLQGLMVPDFSDDEDPDEAIVLSPDSGPFESSPLADREDYFGPYSPSATIRSLHRNSSLSLVAKNTPTLPKKRRKPLARLHTEYLLKMVLQDAQARLVFRAQALIQADVQYYSPKPADLDYPDKLKSTAPGPLVRREVAISLDVEDDDEPAFLSLPPPDSQETWYPTLRVTLWVLSCLYTYIDGTVFADLAQEAVGTCRKSLSTASDQIGAKKDHAVDGKLFLVRHLLILKEMTAGLDLGRASKQYEWAGVTDFLRALLENATSFLGYGRSQPARGEFAPDAKVDLDRELKRACEDLISQCTTAATAPLRAFLDRCNAYAAAKGGNSADLAKQDWATPRAVTEVHDEFRKTAEQELARWRSELMLYLQDEETVRVLIPPAQGSIVDVYRQFHDLIRSEYDFGTAAALSTPSAIANQLEGALRA